MWKYVKACHFGHSFCQKDSMNDNLEYYHKTQRILGISSIYTKSVYKDKRHFPCLLNIVEFVGEWFQRVGFKVIMQLFVLYKMLLVVMYYTWRVKLTFRSSDLLFITQ